MRTACQREVSVLGGLSQANRVMTSKPTVSNRVIRCSVSVTSPSAIWRVTSRAGFNFPRATSGRLVVVEVRIEAAAKRVDPSIETWMPPPVASLTACATCSGERPRAWNVTTPYPASGSSPSHSGCRCVPSKRVLVLYSSYLPSKAADLVRFRRLATSACVSGLKVRTASRAWSRIC